MRTRVGVLALLLAALIAAAAAARGKGARRASPPLPVLGFQSSDSSPRLIDRSAPSISLVGVAAIGLTGPGRVSAPDGAILRQLARAHADGRPAVLVINNWSDSVNDFSEPLAYATLSDPVATASAAWSVVYYAVAQGWNGVSVDLEALTGRDRAGLSTFVADLRSDLPAVDTLSVSVQASTSLGDYSANGYDLAALTAAANELVLMAYDDHGPWEDTPGPIGPLAWQRAAVRAIEQAVPADRIYLAVADYAYAWRPHSNDTLTVAQARALVARSHARRRWVASAGEWTAKLRDGSVVWWSDARSITRRAALARALGLYGIAVWSLGTGDPIPPAG